ncbi:cytochrome b/b6 domain-containing protein [Pseudomonas profundi]|uniref:cytochrome b/b6 domain-containing protein n=1 Tax=Pseudomonas profundi TaxID=1981513 RepID=UPI00123BA15B|nr:cytochrome b/b6 domain-containing protein [Pseudomonas profundi]
MQVRGWDLPLRLFHWLLVVAVTGSLATIYLGGTWMVWHERFGLAVLGLLVFRVLWGLVGSTHARFSDFFPTPRALLAHFRGHQQSAGHTPVGGLSVLAMLGLFGFQALSGLVATDDIAFTGPLRSLVSSSFSNTLSSWHRWTEELIYVVIGLHILAIAVYQLRGKKLVGAMLHGKKDVSEPVSDPRRGSWIALLVVLILAGLAVWAASGAWIPAPAPAPATPAW